MSKYKVVIHYEGAFKYTIEADSLEEAEEKAYALYSNEDNDAFAENLADSFIADSWEENNKHEGMVWDLNIGEYVYPENLPAYWHYTEEEE